MNSRWAHLLKQASHSSMKGQDEVSLKGKVPHFLEGEKCIIGYILRDSKAWQLACDNLSPNDFWASLNQEIWEMISRLAEKYQMTSVSQERKEEENILDDFSLFYELGNVDHKFKHGDILEYLVEARESIISEEGFKRYIKIIKRCSDLRKLMMSYKEGYKRLISCDPSEDVSDVIGEIHHKYASIIESLDIAKKKELLTLQSFDEQYGGLRGFIDHLKSEKNQSFSTPFPELNHLLRGILPGVYYIIAARPSVGKTTLALNIAENICKNYPNKEVLFISLEMGQNELILKMLSSLTGYSTSFIKESQSGSKEDLLIQKAYSKMKKWKFKVAEPFALNAIQLWSTVRSAYRESQGALSVVILDYVQLMGGNKKNKEAYNRNMEIAEISRTIKAICKELNIAFIALSQLNRNVEERLHKKPGLSDLRDSGALEQDADTICFLYRQSDTRRGEVQIVVSKNRMGECGIIHLNFDAQGSKFMSPSMHENLHAYLELDEESLKDENSNLADEQEVVVQDNEKEDPNTKKEDKLIIYRELDEESLKDENSNLADESIILLHSKEQEVVVQDNEKEDPNTKKEDKLIIYREEDSNIMNLQDKKQDEKQDEENGSSWDPNIDYFKEYLGPYNDEWEKRDDWGPGIIYFDQVVEVMDKRIEEWKKSQQEGNPTNYLAEEIKSESDTLSKKIKVTQHTEKKPKTTQKKISKTHIIKEKKSKKKI